MDTVQKPSTAVDLLNKSSGDASAELGCQRRPCKSENVSLGPISASRNA